jgi:hypothetical protein
MLSTIRHILQEGMDIFHSNQRISTRQALFSAAQQDELGYLEAYFWIVLLGVQSGYRNKEVKKRKKKGYTK